MIDQVFLFLKDRLNDHLNANSGWSPTESLEESVVFLDGETMDPVTFKLGAVSEIMISLEEETTMRPPDLYRRPLADGQVLSVSPEIRLNLYVLYVARFKQYEQSLQFLSLIVQYFQNHRVFDHQNAPELDARIQKLILELVTLPFAEQNEIWNALRTTYHPSVLYRVKMLVVRDEDALVESVEAGEPELLLEAS